MTVGYIASSIPAKIVSASGTTLFHVAMLETGDPLQWVSIAQMNSLFDPWVTNLVNLLIPPIFPNLQSPNLPFLPESNSAAPAPLVIVTVAPTIVSPVQQALPPVTNIPSDPVPIIF